MRLEEYGFGERSGLRDKLVPYHGKGLWVHFTNIEKIGLNPKAAHADCPGVYFYPLDWVLEQPNFNEGQLFQITAKHFFVAALDLENSHGLDLTHATEEECLSLARRNGWIDDFEELKSERDIVYYWNEFGCPGALAYGVMRRLSTQIARRRWLSMVKGLDYIVDYSGIIHAREEQQICVINPRIIKVVSKENAPINKNPNSYASSFEYWSKPLTKLMSRLEAKLGGKTKWKDGIPTWRFESGHHWSELTWHSAKLSLTTGFNNTFDRKYYNRPHLEGADEESLALDIESVIRAALLSSKPELPFVPSLSVMMAHHFLDIIVSGGSLPKIRITPNSYVLECEKTSNLQEGGKIEANATIVGTDREAKLHYVLWVNKTMAINEEYDVGNQAVLDIEKKVESLIERYHPESENPRAFRDQRQFTAFSQWMRFGSGMNTSLRKNEWSDQKELSEQVARIFGDS